MKMLKEGVKNILIKDECILKNKYKFYPYKNLSSIFMDSFIVDYSVEIPTRCSIVIEFFIPKLIEGSTCFERHIIHHQELQTVFADSGLYTHVVTGRCPAWNNQKNAIL
jgi:hypothetical protein